MDQFRSRANPAGIKTIVLTPHRLYGTNTAEARQIFFAKNSADLTVNLSRSQAGVLYNAALSCSLPIYNDAVIEFMQDYDDERWVIEATSFHDVTHIIGSAEAGARLQVSHSTGGSQNINRLSFNAVSPIPFKTDTTLSVSNMQTEVVDLRVSGNVDFIMNSGDTTSYDVIFRDEEENLESLAGSTFTMVKSKIIGIADGFVESPIQLEIEPDGQQGVLRINTLNGYQDVNGFFRYYDRGVVFYKLIRDYGGIGGGLQRVVLQGKIYIR